MRDLIEKMRAEAAHLETLRLASADFSYKNELSAAESAWRKAADMVERSLAPEDTDAPGVWTWSLSFGRMGDLSGTFVARPSEVERCFGQTAYFGEVLGKHSSISGKLEAGDFELVSQAPEMVKFVSTHGPFGFGSPLPYCFIYQCADCLAAAEDPEAVAKCQEEELYLHDGKRLCYGCVEAREEKQ